MWRSFYHWFSRQEKDPLHPSIRTVLSYLQHLRRRDLKHSTILSHISALSSCTNKVDGVLVGRHPLVARWVLCDRAQNPPRKSLVHRWNLLLVLAVLTVKPFEPLRQGTPQDLTLKMLFLLAVTSALRVSEIHALCIDPPFLIQNPWSFHLALNPTFLSKTSTEVALFFDLEITAFYPEPTNALEWGFHLMCPVCALHIYLRCTEHSHGPNRSLFGMREGPIACIKAMDKLLPNRSCSFRLSSSRPGASVLTCIRYGACCMVTSWAEIARVPPSEICRGATWSAPCTFAQLYRLDFSGSGFGDAVLETAARAGSA